MAKAPKPGLEDELDGKVAPDADGPVIEVALGSGRHRVVLRTLTAMQVKRLRVETGYSLGRLLADTGTPGSMLDADAVAAVVWLAGVQAGDETPFSAVCETVTVGDILDAIGVSDDGPAVEEPGSPEG